MTPTPYFLVVLRPFTHQSEEVGGAHAEAHVVQVLLACDLQDVIDAGGQIVISHLVPAAGSGDLREDSTAA